MRTVEAMQGERLDEIVLREYGTLDPLEEVLEFNVSLQAKVTLNDADIVYLPLIEKEETKEVSGLW